jgi:hypothetical protein
MRRNVRDSRGQGKRAIRLFALLAIQIRLSVAAPPNALYLLTGAVFKTLDISANLQATIIFRNFPFQLCA